MSSASALILSGATAMMAYANAYPGTATAMLGALLVGLADVRAAGGRPFLRRVGGGLPLILLAPSPPSLFGPYE